MPRLPERPNIDHLKKQARELLRLYETGDPAALARSRNSLPATADKGDAAIIALRRNIRVGSRLSALLIRYHSLGLHLFPLFCYSRCRNRARLPVSFHSVRT
jgi:hypothetical protein